MAKITLSTIGSRYGSIDALNANFDAIEEAFNNTLSRDGSLPNGMEADLDMNNNAILNYKSDVTNPSSLITVGNADSKYVKKTGDSLSGSLDMGNNDVTNAKIITVKTLVIDGKLISPNEISFTNAIESLSTSQIIDPEPSAGLLSDGSFPTSPKEEMSILLSGQNPDHTLPKVGPVLGQTVFCPVQEMSTGMRHHRTYPVPGTTTFSIIPMMHIRSFSSMSPIDLKIFEPVRISYGAVLGFKCIADYPIQAVMTGGVSALVRLGTDANARAQVRIVLVGQNTPSIELSANQPLGRSITYDASKSIKNLAQNVKAF
jgi:hypothetical protein